MTKKISIEGMTCMHCAKHVEEALLEVAGVEAVKVNLKGKYAEVELSKPVEFEEIKSAVEEAGYEATNIE